MPFNRRHTSIFQKRRENKLSYIVTKGRKVGFFFYWEDCEESVKGFSGACYETGYAHCNKVYELLKNKDVPYIKEFMLSPKRFPASVDITRGGYDFDDHESYQYNDTIKPFKPVYRVFTQVFKETTLIKEQFDKCRDKMLSVGTIKDLKQVGYNIKDLSEIVKYYNSTEEYEDTIANLRVLYAEIRELIKQGAKEV